MSYYFLVASLKTLQIGDEPPISTEGYVESCSQWVTPREQEILRRVLLGETHLAPCALCHAWNDIETQLQNSCAMYRAQTYGVDANEYLRPHEGFNGQIEVAVSEAFSLDDPVEMEQILDRCRWQLAEELISDDPFGFEKLLVYGIQLRIVERWNQMDVHIGKKNLEAVITRNTTPKEEQNCAGNNDPVD